MRVIVLFDLPMQSSEERRVYSKFRRNLIKSGFMMLQESVYIKMALNSTQVNQIIGEVKKIKPEKGLVQVLSITEKQFQNMEHITGTYQSDVLDSDERLVILWGLYSISFQNRLYSKTAYRWCV